MKRSFFILIALCAALCACAVAENSENPAADRAREIERFLTGVYSAAEVPAIYADELSGDYDMIARADEEGRSYVLAIRKAEAPPLPEGVFQDETSEGGWGEPLITLSWRLGVRDEDREMSDVLYSFENLTGAMIQAFDDYKTILILPNTNKRPATIPQAEDILEVMTEEGRERIEYRLEHGFVVPDKTQWKISVDIHNKDTYLAGVTYVPTAFYLNLTGDMESLPQRIEKAKVPKKSVKVKSLFENGVRLSKGYECYYLMSNKKGAAGYFRFSPDKGSPTWHYNLTAYNEIMEAVRASAGVVPEILSVGNLASATLEWPSGGLGLNDGAPPQSQTITDAKSLNQLKKLFKSVKYTGASKCPFSAFLTLTRKNGKNTTMALATDSCNMACMDGLCFEYGTSQKKLLALFSQIDTKRHDE